MSRHVCIYRLTYILRYSYSYRFFGLSGFSVFSGLSNSACKGTTKNAHMQIFTQLFLEKSFFYHFSSFPSAVFISSEASHFPANSPKICRNLSPTSPNHSRRNPEEIPSHSRTNSENRQPKSYFRFYDPDIGSILVRDFLEVSSRFPRERFGLLTQKNGGYSIRFRTCMSEPLFPKNILPAGVRFLSRIRKMDTFFDKKCEK